MGLKMYKTEDNIFWTKTRLVKVTSFEKLTQHSLRKLICK